MNLIILDVNKVSRLYQPTCYKALLAFLLFLTTCSTFFFYDSSHVYHSSMLDGWSDIPNYRLAQNDSQSYSLFKEKGISLKHVTSSSILATEHGDDNFADFCSLIRTDLVQPSQNCDEFEEPSEWVGNRLNSTAKLVLAFPTITRDKQQYIFRTLRKLLKQYRQSKKNDLVVLVMVADENTTIAQGTVKNLTITFSADISTGLLQIIRPSQPYFQLFQHSYNKTNTTMHENYMRWRGKQNFDYSYLMHHGARLADFYMQMEDDMVCNASLLERALAAIERFDEEPWIRAEATQIGFLGKMFPSKIVQELAVYMLRHFSEKPCDWMFGSFTDEQPHPCDLKPPNAKCRRSGKTILLDEYELCFHLGVFSSNIGKRARHHHKLTKMKKL